MPLKNNIRSPTDAILAIYHNLSRRRRAQFLLVILVTLAGAVAELLTLGAIVPFLSIMANPQNMESTFYTEHFLVFFDLKDKENILLVTAFLFAIAVVAAATVRIFLVWASQKYVLRVGHDLCTELYKISLNQPLGFHLDKNSSELIAAVGKVQSIVANVLNPIIRIMISIIISVFIICALIYINTVITFISTIVFGSVYFLISLMTKNRLRENSKKIASAQNTRLKFLQEGFGGIRDIILNKSQNFYVEMFTSVDLELRDAQMVNNFIGMAPHYAIQAFAMVLVAFLTYWLSLADGGLLSATPVLGALALGAQRLMPLLADLYVGWSQINGSHQALQDVLEVFEYRQDNGSSECKPTTSEVQFKKYIKFQKVSFRYRKGDVSVLNCIDMKIPKGSRAAFVGKTGSGKSTAVDLLMGLLQPSEGTIYVDHVALDNVNTSAWQNRIAHVPQSIYLSDTTIAENIALGIDLVDIDMDRIRSAAEQASLCDFIGSLPDGYMTVVGERGTRLSGGQRQRIGIARALYKRADVLVFDEATSALDSRTEEEVMKSIDALGSELTIVMVAHRLSTIQKCDVIIDFGSGKIKEKDSSE